MRRILLAFSLILAASGCSDFPELDAAVSARARSGEYPRILPLDDLLAAVPARTATTGIGNLPARLARLRSRARQMRARPVIDSMSRARMLAALARHR